VALPVLRSLGVRATFFVCPGLFGQQHPDVPGEAGELLRAEEARALHDAGMELGSHTLSHPDLRTLDDEELERELVGSKQAIEELTGEQCRTLAYPYGLYDQRVVRAARAAGYELAFGWLPGPWHPLEAPRLPAPPRHGSQRLALKLLGIRKPGR
jgi:peptidoglycan/xylan/chitin deacetylase (PgdA/CDA1 family)